MKYFVLLLTCILTFHLSFSQGNTTYYLKNGREIIPSEAGVSKPKKGEYIFILDGESINSQDVAYVKKEKETLRVGPVDRNNRLLLYKQISDGPRIDFYSIQEKTTDSYPRPEHRKREREFFEKDQGMLKKINYRNVKEAVSDNPQSLAVLKKAKRLRRITGVTIGLSFVGPLVGLWLSSEEASPVPFVLAAPLTSIIPLSLRNAKHKHYMEALRIYNETSAASNLSTEIK